MSKRKAVIRRLSAVEALGSVTVIATDKTGTFTENMMTVHEVHSPKGPILSAIEPAQTTAAVGAILLMALAVAAIVGGTETRVRRLEPDAIVLLVAYLGAFAAIAAAAT